MFKKPLENKSVVARTDKQASPPVKKAPKPAAKPAPVKAPRKGR